MNEDHLLLILYLLVALRLIVCFFPKIIPSTKYLRACREYLDSFVLAGVVAILLITYIVRSFYIPSESMVPTLLVNDYILVNKFAYTFASPMRGDIVVFRPPHIKTPEGTNFIKRCVAVENDLIAVKSGYVYLNGLRLEEPFINDKPLGDFGPYRIPPGHIFMMGDNRNNSEDSRSWGPLPLKNVVGRAFIVFWPFNRVKLLPRFTGQAMLFPSADTSGQQPETSDQQPY